MGAIKSTKTPTDVPSLSLHDRMWLYFHIKEDLFERITANQIAGLIGETKTSFDVEYFHKNPEALKQFLPILSEDVGELF